MAVNQLSSKGLLPDPNDPYSLSSASSDPASGTSAGGIFSPLAGAQPQLAGGAAGTQALNYGGAVQNAGKQYAFNPKYAAMDQALQRAIANAGFDRTNQISQLDQGFQSQTSEAGRQNQQAIKGLGNRMSSQGIGWSGINLEAQGDLNQDYQRYVGNLGQQYAGGKAAAENQYGRTLGDIAGQREGMFQQQAEEERQAQMAAAQAAAEAQARQQAAQQMQQLQQQMIAQQQAALQQQASMQRQQSMPSSPGIGAGGYQGGANGIGVGQGQNWDQIMGIINSSGDRNALAGFGAVPGLPPQIMDALRARIGALTESWKSEANRKSPVLQSMDSSGYRGRAY